LSNARNRLNGLNAVSADVDRKLEDQLVRRAELETLKAACDGLAEQMVDAQNKLVEVRGLQTRLVPLVAEINSLRTQIKTANERIGTIKYDETTIAEQQKRYAELVAASKGVQAEVVERTRQMQLLSEELARSSAIKDELLGELDACKAGSATPSVRFRPLKISSPARRGCSSSSRDAARRWPSARRSSPL